MSERKYTPPRYDDVYFNGVEWLDSIGSEPENELPNEITIELRAVDRVQELEEAMQRIISFHNTHSEVDPDDYTAVIGPVIEQAKSILEKK